MSSAPLLEVHGLRRAFGERVIIHDISFGLRCGEILFIRGASGVGKSLLLRALAHLDPIQVQAWWKSLCWKWCNEACTACLRHYALLLVMLTTASTSCL